MKAFIPKNRGRNYCSRACAAADSGLKKRKPGGLRTAHGYILRYVPGHPMATKAGYVFEHRLVMSERLGRPLSKNEVVHHKNGIKSDNDIENLELMGKRDHDKLSPPPARPIECPHCHKQIAVSNRVRRVAAVD